MPWSLRPSKRETPADRPAESPPVDSARAQIGLIVGLGNPGSTYAGNRHNVGFWVLNRLARRLAINFAHHSKTASLGEGNFDGSRLVLAKPRTFMNDSGSAVGELMRRYKLRPEELLLIYDDLDLPTGRVRVRDSGGHGGQKGMRSIVASVGSQNFPRIRIGIGRPRVGGEPSWDPEVIAGWVLSDPSLEDRRLLEQAAETAADAAICCLEEGVETAMNRFNRT